MDICNIMLLFLSNVKVIKNNDNKIYVNEYDFEHGIKAKTTNESAVKYLVEHKKINVSKLFVFETEMVSNDVEYVEYVDGSKNTEKLLEDGHTIRHNDFFRKRLKDVVQGILDEDGSYVAIKYKQNSSVKDTMKAVSIMSDRILEYVSSLPDGTNVVLHADATGGMRDANYAMLAVMRLMQYSDIEIGSVIYSDFGSKSIKELSPVYGLFDLVAGAEEFVNFGSVNIIDRYFDSLEKNSVEIKNLREAMKHFAEEIRLCHRKKLINAAKILGNAIENFNNAIYNEKNPIQEKLVKILSNRINKEYDGLFTDDLDDICLIEWCLNHDYLQQALTLYVERVPQLLTVEKKILRINEQYIDRLKKMYYNETSGEEFEFWCLTNYSVDKDFENKIESDSHNYIGNDYKKRILNAIDMMLKCDDTLEQSIEVAENYIKSYIEKEEYIVYATPDKIRKMLTIIKKCYDNSKVLIDDKLMPKEICNMVNNYFANDAKEKFYKSKYGKQRFNILLKSESMDIEGYKKCFSNIRKKYSTRVSLAIKAGIYTLDKNISLDDLDIILYDYSNIKTERNNSNHAKLNGKVIYETAEELKKDMLRSINFIKEVLRKLNR